MSFLGRLYYGACRTKFGHECACALRDGVKALGLISRFRLPLDCLSLNHDQVDGLMRLWTKIHWSSADGMMPGDQLLAIYDLVSSWQGDGDTVELGSWAGLTTCYLATGTRIHGKGRVFAVDTFEGTKEGGGHYAAVEKYGGSTLTAFRQQVDLAGVGGIVEPIVGLTQEVAKQYNGRPIRVLLIDADHSYEGVRRDFEAWSPHVAVGGLIIFHDHLMPDVARFVDEVVEHDASFVAQPGLVVPNVMAVTKRSESVTKPSGGMAPRVALRLKMLAQSVTRP